MAIFFHRWIKGKNPIPKIVSFPTQNLKLANFIGKPTYSKDLMTKLLNIKSSKESAY